MQVYLNPADWSRLTRFGAAAEYFEAVDDPEEDAVPEEFLDDEDVWVSDSAMQYFQVAEALAHVLPLVDGEVAEHLNLGIRRVLCQEGHVDELGASALTEGCYWVTASPETTREILRHAEATDWDAVYAALRNNPPPDSWVMEDMEAELIPFVEQHVTRLREAVAGGFGLLGTCG